MTVSFTQTVERHIASVDRFIENWFRSAPIPPGEACLQLIESMSYSMMGGGKRFRPILALMVGEAFGTPTSRLLPWAVAVEMVHTYSLIHDDLPCMDDDDERRGRPTNHKVYGEAAALLAGDALLTEAFGLVAEAYEGNLGGRLVALLARQAGVRGMVAGQVLDLAAEAKKSSTLTELQQIHFLKTAAMIRAPIEGAAWISQASPEECLRLCRFADDLGLAFQVADDLLDAQEEGQAGRSFVALQGLAGTRTSLQEISSRALEQLSALGQDLSPLRMMVESNLRRTQ